MPHGGQAVDRILAAACDEFWRAEFADVSVDAIAARAGLSKASVYHHFGDKRSLFEAVFIRQWAICSRGVVVDGACARSSLAIAKTAIALLGHAQRDARLPGLVRHAGQAIGSDRARKIVGQAALSVFVDTEQAQELDLPIRAATGILAGLLVDHVAEADAIETPRSRELHVVVRALAEWVGTANPCPHRAD